MGKKKIFNDPIYGIISFEHEIIYDLIDHYYFQRLRRISQTGLAHYVYPGSLHTRFQHAIGATHLMTRAIVTLRQKKVSITEVEYEAVCIAILLHDIGHGPYSHALEGRIINLHHEKLSLAYMEKLNEEYAGRLSLAIEIFKGNYNKPFLHELVSSQLDMDRMDYLSRDSYFTGVAEGVIGYDRLIKMLNVADGHLVVEEKGIHSVEKFLVARRLMYWQVYLHKTALGVEQLLISIFERVKYLLDVNVKVYTSKGLLELVMFEKTLMSNSLIDNDLIEMFTKVDDVDILDMVKQNVNSDDYILSYMCQSLIKRQLFKVYLSPHKPTQKELENIKTTLIKSLGIDDQLVNYLVLTGFEANVLYNAQSDEIRILQKNGDVVSFSQLSEFNFESSTTGKYFLCHPKQTSN